MQPGDIEERDGLLSGPARRRGAGLNPGNRFEKVRLHVLGEERERQRLERLVGDDCGEESCGDGDNTPAANPVLLPAANADAPADVPVELIPDHTRTIINRVAPTSDVPFDWTVNPYRGCEHGCIYCFARPYHEFLGYSCGLDFETKIVVKHDAPDLLRQELAHPRWRGEPVVMSATTDIYQPVEHKLQLARRCLEVMAGCGQPVSTMTKSALVLRDVDLWQKLGAMNAGRVTVTLVTLDDALAKSLEPRAASPMRRLHLLRELVKAKVPVSVNIAPVIPGLTDAELPAVMKAVADAGATRVAWALLRLPYQVKDLFLDWLARSVHPSRAKRVESLVRESRGGKLYDAGLGRRRRGRGPIVEQLRQTFDVFTRKYGLNRDVRPLSSRWFRPPPLHGQMSLFDTDGAGNQGQPRRQTRRCTEEARRRGEGARRGRARGHRLRRQTVPGRFQGVRAKWQRHAQSVAEILKAVLFLGFRGRKPTPPWMPDGGEATGQVGRNVRGCSAPADFD